jgi:SAM-dependent methyltransferase
VEPSEYRILDRVEDQMWWFAAARRNLLSLSERLPLDGIGRQAILDAGCGTGGLLVQLAAHYPHRSVVGLDLNQQACVRAAAKSAQLVCTGSVNALPFPDGAFAAIFSADVLCHRRVDERSALLQFHRCLVDGGWLVLNLPAYRWMLSQHDGAVHNVRRYTANGLQRLLEAAGFRCVYATYWNAVLFPLMVLARKLLPGGDGVTSDVKPYPRPVDRLCRAATLFEHLLLRGGLNFPFGGSVLAVAAKEAATHD